MSFLEPQKNCNICNRLNAHIKVQREKFPHFFNNPVKGIGSLESELLIVGLAPGLKGANRTGIPFTGDYSGMLLMSNLKKIKYIKINETFNENMKIRITNSIKCLPPKNKPTSIELKNCNQFLSSEIKVMKNLKIILTIGLTAHQSVLSVFKKKRCDFKFKHLFVHQLDKNTKMINSYHCSKYNILTKRLSEVEFEKVFLKLNRELVIF